MKNYIVRTIRRKHGTTYVYEYRDKHGKPLSQKRVKEATNGLYLPPALDKVRVNLHKRAKVLAIGYDGKGRAQYTYNKKFTEKQSKEKFDHMITLGESYQKILRQIQRDMYSEAETKDKQIATILRFVIDCSFRVGNEKYTKDNKSYGVTTLEARHVQTKDSEIKVSFTGKKGVHNHCVFKNKKLSRNLKKKKRTLKPKDRLFTYRKGSRYYNVRPSDVNRYLRKFGNFTTKNFRTWTANIELIHQIMKHPEIFTDISETQKKRIANECIDKVAEKLHNTRAVCKSNYLDPRLVEATTNGTESLRAFHKCATKEDYTNEYIRYLKQLSTVS
jgi:DNA topoisomerase I